APTSTTFSDTNLAAGSYSYRVRAADAAGNLGGYTNTATASVGDTGLPTVSITAPTAGATVSGTITITATATDASGIAGVQFIVDGANLGAEDTSSPFSVQWDTTSRTNGTHSLTASARDNSGNSATSAAVS